MTVVWPPVVAALLAAVVVLLLVVGLVVIFGRRRRPSIEVHQLDTAEARRYLDSFAGVERDFEARPEVAIAQARGIVEEVLRRMGFPDRVDAAQKAHDLAAHFSQAAAALEAADRALREDGGPEAWRRALTSYREVLDRLFQDATGR